jgi:hypothetical protein
MVGFMEGDDYSDAATVVHLGECFKGRTWGGRGSSEGYRHIERRGANRQKYVESIGAMSKPQVLRLRLSR